MHGRRDRPSVTLLPVALIAPDAEGEHDRLELALEGIEAADADIAAYHQSEESLIRIGQIYDIDNSIRGAPPDRRKTVRQQQTKPKIETLRRWWIRLWAARRECARVKVPQPFDGLRREDVHGTNTTPVQACKQSPNWAWPSVTSPSLPGQGNAGSSNRLLAIQAATIPIDELQPVRLARPKGEGR